MTENQPTTDTTPTETLTAGTETDRRVAEAMGYTFSRGHWHTPPDVKLIGGEEQDFGGVCLAALPDFSGDIGAAMTAAQSLTRRNGYDFSVRRRFDLDVQRRISERLGLPDGCLLPFAGVLGRVTPLDICGAILQTAVRRGEKEKQP